MGNKFFSDLSSFVYNPSITNYFLQDPFDPPESYPELPFVVRTDKKNKIYPMVRQLMGNLRMDEQNIGTEFWNPFKDLAKPGDIVVIKPNLITHWHYLSRQALYSTVVHGSIIRPLIDYLNLAMRGRGKIIIADNPIVATDFKALMRFTGIQEMATKLNERGYVEIVVLDLRPKILREKAGGDFYYLDQEGDPSGYVDIDLGKESLFSEFDDRESIRYYTLADPSVDHIDPKFKGKGETDKYHNSKNHIYTISRSILHADLFINIAKMKTHCKAGVTLLLKNVVGVVYGKGCIPHWRQGIPPDGDSSPYYPPTFYTCLQKFYIKLRRWMRIHRVPGFRGFRNFLQKHDFIVGQYKHLEHGNWRGNDTLWRTILDLNRILIYADKNGLMRDEPQRKYFGLVDGIISQQGEGPMAGKPTLTSIIFGGFNPVAVDALVIKAMGISPRLIKSVSKAWAFNKWRISPNGHFDISLPQTEVPIFNFTLPKGWR